MSPTSIAVLLSTEAISSRSPSRSEAEPECSGRSVTLTTLGGVTAEDDDLIVEGYRFCRCGEWLPEFQTLCAACAAEVTSLADDAIVIEVEGYPIQLKDRGRKKRKRPKTQPMRDRPMEARARDRARQRALFRLADIHRPLFEMLFVEEQYREGLDPAPPRSYKDGYTAQMVEAVLSDIEDFRHRVEAEVLGATSTDGDAYAEDQRPA